jgi:hypothetical protein
MNIGVWRGGYSLYGWRRTSQERQGRNLHAEGQSSTVRLFFIDNFFTRYRSSVADPDPFVFGPPGSGSGSFYHQLKIVRKPSITTVLLLLFDFLSLKNDVNVPSESNKQKIL